MAKMGGARVFFTVLANAQVDNLISDSKAASAIMESVYLDSIEGITEGLQEMFDAWGAFSDAMIDSAMDVEIAKIHFRKFFDEGIEASKEFENQLINTGLAFGISAEQSIESGASMMQLEPVLGGKGAGTSATQGAMLMGTVGMMDTETALKTLMQLQMQTNFMYEGASELAQTAGNEELKRQVVLGNTVKFVNMLNEAENKTGANIQSITQSMSQYAASAKLANMELSEQVALSASLIEQGEEQGKSGRAIKMMLARLASDRSNNNELLEKHGVLVQTEEGNMKGLMQIMGELRTNTDQYGRSWENLNSVEKQNIAIAVAGSHHYVRFLKLMENYNRTSQIQAIVTDSAGSAMEEFANFQKSAAFDLQRYNNAIERQNALTGEHLIPAKVQAARAELMFAEARNAVLSTYMGGRAATGMEMAMVGFRQAQGIMQAVFAYKVLRVAMDTHAIVQQQMLTRQTMTTKAQQDEIKSLIMTSTTRQKVYEQYMQGESAMAIVAKGKYSQLQVDHAINEGLINRIKLHQRNAYVEKQAVADVINAKTIMSQSEAQQFRNSFKMDKMERAAMDSKRQAMVAELEILGAREMRIQARITSGKITTQRELEETNMTLAKIRAETTLLRVEDMRMQSKMNLHKIAYTTKNADLSSSKQMLYFEQVAAEQNALAARIQQMYNSAKATGIKLDATRAATLNYETKATLMNAQGTNIGTQGQMMLNNEKRKGIALLGPMANGMMLASMVVSFLGDEQTAATASMLLMFGAMVPLTISMMNFGRAGAFAALQSSIATVGFAAVAGLAAYALASSSVMAGKAGNEFDEMSKSIAQSEADLEALNGELDKFNDDTTNNIMAVEDAFTDSLDAMGNSMEEFDNKRLELFFGGRQGRMQSAMFKEIKMNGVENLFFAPEINMNNTFNGLTYTQAANEIADMVIDRLGEASGIMHQGA